MRALDATHRTSGIFRAGASHYGIGDLRALASDTHKFESRYLDSLIGRLPQDEAVFIARSPLEHLDGLTCPVAFFQVCRVIISRVFDRLILHDHSLTVIITDG